MTLLSSGWSESDVDRMVGGMPEIRADPVHGRLFTAFHRHEEEVFAGIPVERRPDGSKRFIGWVVCRNCGLVVKRVFSGWAGMSMTTEKHFIGYIDGKAPYDSLAGIARLLGLPRDEWLQAPKP